MHSQQICSFAKHLETVYDTVRVDANLTRRFSPESFQSTLLNLIESHDDILQLEDVGNSFEGRPIRLVHAGKGTTLVLLWSQMHGDEPTATLAMADILSYIIKTKSEELTQMLLSTLHLLFLPLLNPDGAARFQRRSAQNIDLNRDALALRTPESRILRNLQNKFKPKFAFNLHDQELNTVGTSKELAAISLLVPALNPQTPSNDVHTKSKQIAAFFASIMNCFIPKNVARYDDTFEPRAFGENMLQWGTSVLLVESGHALNDPEKYSIRKLNFIGLLTSLYAIATDKYASANISFYESLPRNSKQAYDVIIRNVTIEYENGTTTQADLAISYQVDSHTESTPKLVDLGDLSTFVGLSEVNGKAKKIHHSLLKLGEPFVWADYFK